MRSGGESLFDRRLLVIAGKGGVGKTTIACALSVLAAQRGKRTLLVEVDGVGRAAQLLGVVPDTVGVACPVQEALSVMSVEGTTALAEYLQLITPVKHVLQAVLSSRIYQYFVAVAPGLRELMTIGKVWYEAERLDEATGQRIWDLVVLDAPATGHSLQYLGMPLVAHEVFRSGLVGRESQHLIDLLTDPVRTAVNLVCTAEEMPVNETLEMYQRIVEELHMPLGMLFVNRMHDAPFTGVQIEDMQRRVGALHDARQRAIADDVVRRAKEEVSWSAINRRYLARLTDKVMMPVLEVPFMFAEEFGVEQVQAIATQFAATLSPAARRRKQHDRP